MLGLPYKLNSMWISNNNIILLTTTASAVILLEKKRMYIPIVNYLSSSVLAIYLITEFGGVRASLNEYLLPHVLKGYGYFYLIVLCIGCIMVDKLRVYLFCLFKIKLS